MICGSMAPFTFGKTRRRQFNELLRLKNQASKEICNVLKRTGVTSGALKSFDNQSEPTLTASVDHIVVRSWNTQVPELWWCASLQSAELEARWGHLSLIVKKHNEKAATWDWPCAAEP